MTDKNIIETFLKPESVAVIGASKNPLKGGNRIVNNLIYNNFKGKIFPINPNADGMIYGLKFRKSILDVDEDVDLAIFYVPNHKIPELLKECTQKEVKGAIIEASGFEEAGELGLKLKEKIIDITENFTKIRILGPNCMGITRIDADSDAKDKGGFFSSFAVFNKYKRGNIAIISQSGMLNGGYLMHVISKYPDLGIRYSCSIGNKMDLSEIEFLEYFIDDPTVNVIALYLESFKDPRKFIELSNKVRTIPKKTIILVKGGLTRQGQIASFSHTGALAENGKLIEAIIKQSHVIQAKSFYELFQFARTFSMVYESNKKLPVKGNIAMVAGSGGSETITADLATAQGLTFPKLGDKTYEIIKNFYPTWMPFNKSAALIDIWPAMEKEMIKSKNTDAVTKAVYEALINDPEIEGIFNMLFVSRLFRNMTNLDILTKIARETEKPMFFWLIGEIKEINRVSKILSANNLPEFPNLSEMVKNFQILVNEGKNKKNI